MIDTQARSTNKSGNQALRQAVARYRKRAMQNPNDTVDAVILTISSIRYKEMQILISP